MSERGLDEATRGRLGMFAASINPCWVLVVLSVLLGLITVGMGRYSVATVTGPGTSVLVTRFDRFTGKLESCIQFPVGSFEASVETVRIERQQPDWCESSRS